MHQQMEWVLVMVTFGSDLPQGGTQLGRR